MTRFWHGNLKKTPVLLVNTGVCIVESERIELSSKQAIKEFSTRLFFH